jgi:Xaa-Pro dipeptidase
MINNRRGITSMIPMLLNRERAEERMAEADLEALVATSPANVFYASDCYPYGASFALLPLDEGAEPALVTSVSGSTPVVLMSPPWFSDVRYYGEFYVETGFAREPLSEAERAVIRAQESWEASRESDPVAILLKILEERGLTRGRIGVDEANLGSDHPLWRRVKEALPDVELVSAKKTFTEIRMIKTVEEIRRIGEATRITERAWEAALEPVSEGTTEREFADAWQGAIISEGGLSNAYLGAYWPPVAFGRHTAFSDIAQPSGYGLREGDVIRFDGGATYMGYPCDMARAAVFGRADEKLKRYWRALWEGEQEAVSMAQPGTVASDIFEAAVSKVRRSGIGHYRRHHTGHGWGLEGYDPPTIGPRDGTSLEEGMVLCFETPYYEVGWGGLLHEDVVVVGEEGAKYLSTPEDELRVVG